MRRVTLYIISDSSCEEAEAEHVKGQLVHQHVISDSDLMCRKTQNWTFISRNSDKEHIWILMENMIKVPMKPKLLFKCVTPSLTYTPASGTKKLLWRYFNGILVFATSWKKSLNCWWLILQLDLTGYCTTTQQFKLGHVLQREYLLVSLLLFLPTSC